MNEIVGAVLSLLCSGSSMYNCQQFLVPYEGNVIAQLLMLTFFPMIFITLLIVIVAGAVTNSHKKFEVLIAMAAIMFIIIQGYWPIVLQVSKFWWLSVIFLGGIWALTHKMGVKASTQTADVAASRSWLLRGIIGDRGLNPFEAFGSAKQIDQKIHAIRDEIRVLDDRRRAAAGDKEKSSYADLIAEKEREIVSLQHMKRDWKRV